MRSSARGGRLVAMTVDAADNNESSGDGIEPPLSYDQYPDGAPPYPDFTQLPSVHLAFIVVYLVVTVLSIVGNALVCLTVFRNKKMHTAINYYIVNLGLCDLLVGAFVMPFKLVELTAPAHWAIMTDALCTATMYLQTVFVFCSVLTLVATCIERYFAIVHPLESRMHHSKSRAKCILVFVWATPCLVAAPFLYPAKAYANFLYSQYGAMHRLTCFDTFSEDFRRGYFLFLFLFIYLLPLCFISCTCLCIFRVLLRGIPFHRQGSLRRQEANRRKVAKMVMVVVSAYAISWTPYFMVTIVSQFQKDSFLHHGQFFFTMLCINLFAFTNSSVNPFIYAAMSVRFRHGFRSIFRLVLCCRRHSATRNGARGAGNDNTGSKLRHQDGGRQSSTSCLHNASSSDTPPSSLLQSAVGGAGPAQQLGKTKNNPMTMTVRADGLRSASGTSHVHHNGCVTTAALKGHLLPGGAAIRPEKDQVPKNPRPSAKNKLTFQKLIDLGTEWRFGGRHRRRGQPPLSDVVLGCPVDGQTENASRTVSVGHSSSFERPGRDLSDSDSTVMACVTDQKQRCSCSPSRDALGTTESHSQPNLTDGGADPNLEPTKTGPTTARQRSAEGGGGGVLHEKILISKNA